MSSATIFDILRSRYVPKKDVLSYDLRSDSILLDGIHLNRPDKSKLSPLLRQNFNQSDYFFENRSVSSCALAADFISTIRKISPGNMGNVNAQRSMEQD